MEDIKTVFKSIDRHFNDIARDDGFEPGELAMRVGGFGAVTRAEWRETFDRYPQWVETCYLLEANTPEDAEHWERVYRQDGLEALQAILAKTPLREVYPLKAGQWGDC